MLLHAISTSRGDAVRAADRGIALVMTMLFTGLLTALAVAVMMLSTVETWLSAGSRTSQQLSYAADAGIARMQVDLAASSDWSAVLATSVTSVPSAFNDGLVFVTLSDRTTVDLAAETRALQADTDARCTSVGGNPDCPEWHLFAHAAVDKLIPGRLVRMPAYVAAWIADDGADGDGNPAADANGRLLLHAKAFGPGGARRSVEAAVGRVGTTAMRMLSWREIR